MAGTARTLSSLRSFAPLAVAILVTSWFAWLTYGPGWNQESWLRALQHLAALHYGQAGPSEWVATNFRLMRFDAILYGAILAVALIAVRLSARWTRATSVTQILKNEWGRKLGAIYLLVLALVLLPQTTLSFEEAILSARDGADWSTSPASFFGSWLGDLIMFLLWSRLLLGRSDPGYNDELSQHFRARAYQIGFWGLLAGCVALFSAWLASPLWGDLMVPVLMSLGLIVPMLSFSWQELRPEGGD